MLQADSRLDPTEPILESLDRPLVCRIVAMAEDPERALESLPQEVLAALGDDQDCDFYDLAKGLYELGLLRPAVTLLEREMRTRGARVGACELMGKCLLALGRPELALPWFVGTLRDAELDSDATFELIRLASVCRMQIDDLAESQVSWQRAA